MNFQIFWINFTNVFDKFFKCFGKFFKAFDTFFRFHWFIKSWTNFPYSLFSWWHFEYFWMLRSPLIPGGLVIPLSKPPLRPSSMIVVLSLMPNPTDYSVPLYLLLPPLRMGTFAIKGTVRVLYLTSSSLSLLNMDLPVANSRKSSHWARGKLGTGPTRRQLTSARKAYQKPKEIKHTELMPSTTTLAKIRWVHSSNTSIALETFSVLWLVSMAARCPKTSMTSSLNLPPPK